MFMAKRRGSAWAVLGWTGLPEIYARAMLNRQTNSFGCINLEGFDQQCWPVVVGQLMSGHKGTLCSCVFDFAACHLG